MIMSTINDLLSPEDVEAFGRDMDAIRQEVLDDLGQRDVDYIRDIIRKQRGLEITGRALLFAGILPPAWLAGTACLSLSKILDNMEIGHNIMHGQYDWTGDPALASENFDWDNTSPASQWKHSHNYLHHTHTNIVGKDRDVGYGILRMSEEQRWNPYYLGNPLYAFLLAALFQWGVAVHDLEVDRIGKPGDMGAKERKRRALEIADKAKGQVTKDYVLFPLLAGPFAPLVLSGNLASNLARNFWSFTIIFCGHFPDGVEQFSEAETQNETRGQWYVRQLLGSANIRGSKLFHILSGNLSHQIEHHLFPDLPAHRYAEIAPKVRAACERYGLPYNTGSLSRQFGTTVKRIFKLALPDREALPDAA
jgi:linoleoyl-CoA desaturase